MQITTLEPNQHSPVDIYSNIVSSILNYSKHPVQNFFMRFDNSNINSTTKSMRPNNNLQTFFYRKMKQRKLTTKKECHALNFLHQNLTHLFTQLLPHIIKPSTLTKFPNQNKSPHLSFHTPLTYVFILFYSVFSLSTQYLITVSYSFTYLRNNLPETI